MLGNIVNISKQWRAEDTNQSGEAGGQVSFALEGRQREQGRVWPADMGDCEPPPEILTARIWIKIQRRLPVLFLLCLKTKAFGRKDLWKISLQRRVSEKGCQNKTERTKLWNSHHQESVLFFCLSASQAGSPQPQSHSEDRRGPVLAPSQLAKPLSPPDSQSPDF